MFPYWLLFSVYAAGAVNAPRAAATNALARPLFVLAGLFTAAMIGFRFEVGGDWFAYLQIFQDIGYQDLDIALTMSDPGYAFLNWAAHAFGLDYWAVNLACGLIFVWGLQKFAMQQPNPWLVLVVAIPYFIIVVSMGYTRQAVAISLVMAALVAMNNGTLVRAAFYFILAVVFHKTAIIILTLVGFAAARRKILTAAVAAASVVLLYFLFLASRFETLVSSYVDQAYASEGALIRVAMNLPPALLFLFFGSRFATSAFEYKLWRNFSFAALGAFVVLFQVEGSTTFVDRLALYLVPLQLFVLARMPYAFAEERAPASGPLTIAIIVYSATIQLVWLTSATHAAFWVPYQVYPLFD